MNVFLIFLIMTWIGLMIIGALTYLIHRLKLEKMRRRLNSAEIAIDLLKISREDHYKLIKYLREKIGCDWPEPGISYSSDLLSEIKRKEKEKEEEDYF